MKNILVAIDFSKHEHVVIDVAYQMAEKFDAKLWLIHIAAPDPDFVGYDVGPQYIRDGRAFELRKEHKQLEVITNILKEKGVDADGLMVQGATIQMIMVEAEKLNIDLMVVGHHDHSFLYNAFIGSKSAQIVKKSKIPVLVVPID